jgi:hypothetical protein
MKGDTIKPLTAEFKGMWQLAAPTEFVLTGNSTLVS